MSCEHKVVTAAGRAIFTMGLARSLDRDGARTRFVLVYGRRRVYRAEGDSRRHS